MARRSMLKSGSRLARGAVIAAALTAIMGFAQREGILDEFMTAARDSWAQEAAEDGSRLKDVPLPGGSGGASQPDQQSPSTAPVAPKEQRTQYREALTTLSTLPVKGKAPMTGYDRSEFGSEWSDAVGDWPAWSRDGLDSRNNALSRDLTKHECKPGTVSKKSGACKVLSGDFIEPYTNQPFHFIYADSRMEHSLDIDHVVALGNAWVSGAWKFDEATRALIANDPLNLWAVSASENREKSDANAAEWLPPNKAIRAKYVATQIEVKAKYGLAVTQAEKDAMTRVLNAALGQ